MPSLVLTGRGIPWGWAALAAKAISRKLWKMMVTNTLAVALVIVLMSFFIIQLFCCIFMRILNVWEVNFYYYCVRKVRHIWWVKPDLIIPTSNLLLKLNISQDAKGVGKRIGKHDEKGRASNSRAEVSLLAGGSLNPQWSKKWGSLWGSWAILGAGAGTLL